MIVGNCPMYKICLVTVGLLCCSIIPANAIVRFVTPGGTGDGTSWTNAGALQATVDAAANGDEVWAVSGTYTSESDCILTLKEGVDVYGGFAGTESLLTERDWTLNITILDGEGARRCVTGADTALLDGFTITRGMSTDYGGGLYNESASPTISNCIFADNNADFSGGAVFGLYASPVITSCTFINNLSGQGGAIYSNYGTPILTGCIFSGNMAEEGGAICISSGDPHLTSCKLLENNAVDAGGGIYNDSGSPVLTNCLFRGNVSYDSGGAMGNLNGTPVLMNCTFTANRADYNHGGGISNEFSSPQITNSIFWGNAALTDPEIYNDPNSSPTIIYSCMAGGYTGTGNIDADPLFVDSFFSQQLREGSSCIDTGTTDGAPVDDIQEQVRPDGEGVDMGAYEGVVNTSDIVTLTLGVTPDGGGVTLPPAGVYSCVRDEKILIGAQGIGMAFNTWTGDVSGTTSEISVVMDTNKTATANLVPNIYYVDDDSAAPTPDGRSWAGAYKDIQSAVDAAYADEGGEVWVATGIYLSTENFVVAMKEGVALYGGFAAIETERDQRDVNANATAIDGENNRQGVKGADNAILDGFTITNGTTTEYGGGMYILFASPTIQACLFSDNTADEGGGLYIVCGIPTITACTFTGNTADFGGGLFSNYTAPKIHQCIFTSNAANFGGGAMYNLYALPAVTNCVFQDNTAYYNGGGMENSYSTPVLYNCTFTGNEAEYTGGGGMFNSNSTTVATNCIFWDNLAPSNAEILDDVDTSTEVTYSCVAGGYTGTGNINADPLFIDAVGGDLSLEAASPCIDAGTANNAPTVDIRGIVRPQAIGWDMGAYEMIYPFITLIGDASVTIECGDSYEDAGATAWDVDEGDLTGDIVTENPVDTGMPGTYEVRYNVSNSLDVAAKEAIRTVEVVDTIAPVISLLGDAVVTIDCGTAYADAGATAYDVCAGDISAAITVNDSGLNINVPGEYIITYNVADNSPNAALEVTRTVTVSDNCIEGEGEIVEGEGEIIEGEGEIIEGEGEIVEGEGEVIEGEGESVEGEGEVVEGEGEIVEGEGEVIEGEGEVVEGEGEGEIVEGEGEIAEGEGEVIEGEGEVVEGEGEGEIVEGEGEIAEGEGESVEGEGEVAEGEGETEGEMEGEGEDEPEEGEMEVEGIAQDLLDQFDQVDSDNDGALDYEETLTLLPQLTQDQFDTLDTDDNDLLSREELVASTSMPATVPDVVGMYKDDAFAAIFAAKLKVGSVSLQFNDTVPEDYIINQTPAAGTRVVYDSGVSLVQSKGPEYEEKAGCGCKSSTQEEKKSLKKFFGNWLLIGTALPAYYFWKIV